MLTLYPPCIDATFGWLPMQGKSSNEYGVHFRHVRSAGSLRSPQDHCLCPAISRIHGASAHFTFGTGLWELAYAIAILVAVNAHHSRAR